MDRRERLTVSKARFHAGDCAASDHRIGQQMRRRSTHPQHCQSICISGGGIGEDAILNQHVTDLEAAVVIRRRGADEHWKTFSRGLGPETHDLEVRELQIIAYHIHRPEHSLRVTGPFGIRAAIERPYNLVIPPQETVNTAE